MLSKYIVICYFQGRHCFINILIQTMIFYCPRAQAIPPSSTLDQQEDLKEEADNLHCGMQKYFGVERQHNSFIAITVLLLGSGNGITFAITHSTTNHPFTYCPCHQVIGNLSCSLAKPRRSTHKSFSKDRCVASEVLHITGS